MSLAAGVKFVTSVEGITEYRLANGLRVLLFPDPSKSNVTVNITYLVGSRHEGYGETGMAHLLEHMLFKGTPSAIANIPKELQDHGARSNGTTWVDRTNYFETFAATDENLEFGARARSRPHGQQLRRARRTCDSEMTVVRNEFEMGENSPRAVLEERIMAAAFDWHNYGKSTIGNRTDIEARADRAAAGVLPQVLPARQRRCWSSPASSTRPRRSRWSTSTSAPFRRPARAARQDLHRGAGAGRRTHVTLRRVGDVRPSASSITSPAAHDDRTPPSTGLATILGDQPSGRLYKALVETKKAASVSTNTYPAERARRAA